MRDNGAVEGGIIECTGVVGAGKSTVCAALRDLLKRRGVDALSLDEAVLRCLRRSRLHGLADRVLPTAMGDRLVRTTYFRVLEPCYAVRFGCEHPRLAWRVLKSQLGLPISLYDRWFAWSRFFRVAARYRLLRDRLRSGEVVVADEGFVHRALTLYGWSPEGPGCEQLLTYLRLLPLASPLVVVRTPVEASLERAMARGLPARMGAKGQRAVARFMANSEQIIVLASRFWGVAGRTVVEIENGGPLDETMRRVGRAAADFPTWRSAPCAGDLVTQGG